MPSRKYYRCPKNIQNCRRFLPFIRNSASGSGFGRTVLCWGGSQDLVVINSIYQPEARGSRTLYLFFSLSSLMMGGNRPFALVLVVVVGFVGSCLGDCLLDCDMDYGSQPAENCTCSGTGWDYLDVLVRCPVSFVMRNIVFDGLFFCFFSFSFSFSFSFLFFSFLLFFFSSLVFSSLFLSLLTKCFPLPSLPSPLSLPLQGVISKT